MINLKAENAVRLIEKVNEKLDLWQEKQKRLLTEKVQGQILRTKTRWVEDAEKSTKYFMNLEKNRSKAKTMNRIVNDKGVEITRAGEILEEQRKFYEKLYMQDKQVKFHMEKAASNRLDDTQSEITMEEIASAVKELPKDKSPGPDGITSNFYKVFFGQIKDLLLDAYLHAKETGCLFPTARQGVLVLLPKKGRERKYIKSWRPISLLNVDYKILSKVFTNRIKLVIDSIIDKDQKGFIKGRQISENLRETFNLLEVAWMKQLPAIAVMVDFEKAFDRVDYVALDQALEYFGFGRQMREWVKILYHQFNLHTANNGFLSKSWTPTRGLFQGNPLSSILFLLIAELLSINLRRNPKIEGIDVNGVKYLLSQFANDLTLFLKFKESIWQEVMREFDMFEKSTGMKISYEKTAIYRIGSLRNSDAKFMSTRKVYWTNDPVNILGIFLSHDYEEYVKLNLDPLMEKSKMLLDIWKLRELSLFGKIQVVNSLIASMYVYKMTVLPTLPPSVLGQIESSIKSFIWDGKKSQNSDGSSSGP